MGRGLRLPKRLVNSLACVLLLACFHGACGSTYTTQLSLELPWAESLDNQRVPSAVFEGPQGQGHLLVAVTGLTASSWQLAGTAVRSNGASVNTTPLWATPLPLGSGIPSAVAVAGRLAVLELDGRVLAVQPQDGTLAWNATSPCSLGRPRPISSRAATDAVYLVCHELSGDSTIIALHPSNGTTAWAISSSSVASALAPVRAAAAREGLFVYADIGSNVTALSAADGALLWEVDVAPLALPASEAGAAQGTSVTHLELAGDVLLVREYAAGLSFSAGPFSYLALKLSSNSSAPPTLLWSSNSTAQRDRLAPPYTEASPIVPPTLSEKEVLFFYWSATAPPPPAPSPPPAALNPQWEAQGVGGASVATARSSSSPPTPAARRLHATAAASAAQPSPKSPPLPAAPARPTPAATPTPAPAPPTQPADQNATEAVEAAAAAAAAQAAAEATLSTAVPEQTQGLGVHPPEGFVAVPVLKARSLSTGQEVWSLQLQPVSAPSAAAGNVAVVTSEGLQVLDAGNGTLLWSVEQKLLGIYPYTPTVMAGGEAVAVRNCLDVMAPNSLCLYSPPTQPSLLPEEPAGAQSTAASPPPPPASGAPPALAGWPAAGLAGIGPALRVLLAAGAAAALLLLF